MARSACRDEDGAGADALLEPRTAVATEQVGSDDAAIGDDEAGDRGPLGKANALVNAGKGGQRTADLGAGGVAVGVQDAGQGMSAFAGAEELAVLGIKVRAPFDQLGDADRPLGNQSLGGGTIDQSIASVDGVGEMQRNIGIALHGHGDSALGVVGIGLGHGLLGNDENIAVAGQFDGRAQASYARPHYQKIDLLRCFHRVQATTGGQGFDGFAQLLPQSRV